MLDVLWERAVVLLVVGRTLMERYYCVGGVVGESCGFD